MSNPMTCYHCEYFHKEYYYDTDYEEYWLWECMLDRPEADMDQESCEECVPNDIANKLFIRGVLTMEFQEWMQKTEPRFRYMMLSRMKTDCNYYLGNGNRNPENLWAGNEQKQIEHMKALWNGFPEGEKPEWLTMETIQRFAERMGVME